MDNITIIIVMLIIVYLISNSSKKRRELFKTDDKNRLSIMAIFKNEELYLEEWLQYHINEGIHHFYLYTNDENMEKYDFLDKYEDKITIIPWIDVKKTKYSTIQRDAYTHCIKNFIDEYDFLLMLDIDEFLVSLLKNKKVIDIVNKFDKNKVKAIKLQRYNFGANGHIKKPHGQVMDNYKKHEKICSSYKAIANSKYINTSRRYYGVHDHPYKNKEGIIYNSYFKYDEDNEKDIYLGPNKCNKNNVNEIPLVINHYYTKSQEEYLKRCKLWMNGGINNIGYRKNCEKNFKKSNVNDLEGYDYIKQEQWYKYA